MKTIRSEIIREVMPIIFEHIEHLYITTDMTKDEIIFASLQKAASVYSKKAR